MISIERNKNQAKAENRANPWTSIRRYRIRYKTFNLLQETIIYVGFADGEPNPSLHNSRDVNRSKPYSMLGSPSKSNLDRSELQQVIGFSISIIELHVFSISIIELHVMLYHLLDILIG
ncbi:hypothetical protein Syun_009482 [Stephania yunnanensis]|uniref:Uncharacterized protein n=1 Tax=Stephania yunnanensis TaxID=152371 RepID=A0AAP0KG81_9MAGN